MDWAVVYFSCINFTLYIFNSCFIVNAYAGLGGVIIPVILILVAIGIIFMKAFQLTPQWQAYDDIYRGRYNINGM